MTDITADAIRSFLAGDTATRSMHYKTGPSPYDNGTFTDGQLARSWLKQREALELALKFMESVNLAGATEKEYQAALSKINALLEDGK